MGQVIIIFLKFHLHSNKAKAQFRLHCQICARSQITQVSNQIQFFSHPTENGIGLSHPKVKQLFYFVITTKLQLTFTLKNTLDFIIERTFSKIPLDNT